MPEPLEAELELSIDSALASVSDVGNAVAEALEEAGSVGASAIDSSLSAIPALAIEFDTTDAQEQLSLFTDQAAVPVESSLDLDTSEAQQAAEEFGASARESAGGVGSMQDAVTGLNASAGLASGSVGSLGSALSGVSTEAAVAVGAIAAVAGAATAMFHEALDAQSATERFALALGGMVDSVENLSAFKELDTSISQLTLSLGSDDDALRQVISTQVQLATASGKSKKEAADYAQTLAVMAARAVALNPTLGNVDTVATSLGQAFARGSRIAARFQLDLRSSEITARALADTGKTTAAELTQVEKSMAGAQIATEKYGKSLKGDIADGGENVIFTFQRLKQTIKENLETLGAPLVAPVLELMEAAIPTFQAAGKALATFAQSGLPILTIGLKALTPALELFAEVLETIPAPVLSIVASLLALEHAMSIGSVLISRFAPGVHDLGFGLASAHVGAHVAATRMTEFGHGIAGSLPQVSKFSEGVHKVAHGLPLIAVGVFGVTESLKQFDHTTEGAVKGTLGMAASGAAMGATFGPQGIAIGAAAGAVVGLTTALISGGESVEDYRKHFTEMAESIVESTKKVAANKFIDALGNEDRLKLARGDMKGIRDEIIALAKSSPAAAERVIAGFRAMRDETGKPLFTERQLAQLDEYGKRGSKAFKDVNDRKRDAIERDREVASGENAVGLATEKVTASLVEQTKAVKEATDAKHAQADALTDYLDALLAEQDKQFAATKAAQDAVEAEKNLDDVTKDSTKSLLEKEIALNESATAHIKAGLAAGEGALAGRNFASAEDEARAKIDATLNGLELQKAQVKEGGPTWLAIDAYQRKIRDTPQYWLTHLDLLITALSGESGAILVNAAGAAAGGAPANVPFAAEGMVVPARRGGTLINVGEAGATEVILSLGNSMEQNRALLRRAGLGALLGAPDFPSAPQRTTGTATATATAHIDRSLNVTMPVTVAREPEEAATRTVRKLRSLMTVGDMNGDSYP